MSLTIETNKQQQVLPESNMVKPTCQEWPEVFQWEHIDFVSRNETTVEAPSNINIVEDKRGIIFYFHPEVLSLN